MTSTTARATAASRIRARFIADQGRTRETSSGSAALMDVLAGGTFDGAQPQRHPARRRAREVPPVGAPHRDDRILPRTSRLSLAESTSVAVLATQAPNSADLERAAKFTREPFVTEGEDVATALAPGSPRRVAFEAARAELDAGLTQPSVEWRRKFSLLLGLERLLSEDEPRLVDGTVLSTHQVDALSGTLTALLAEAQRNGNGNGHGAIVAAEDVVALAPVGIPGEEEDEEADEEPLDW